MGRGIIGRNDGGVRVRKTIARYCLYKPQPFIFPLSILSFKALLKKFSNYFHKVANLVLCFSSLPPDTISLKTSASP